ncbi:hypothetical protein MACK_000707 [Theileria orientalis]|uniref:t-SNARE coiled-coil homology domain-containing protein n=1 Tax=Theileria orientalis TaxID=68886 RepID=A0A976QTE7_THEOR|nr:hypothetical protein MACK_000707 [Theileria orientalis]
MNSIDKMDKDPYDEAENKVRKSIRKAILLQSQLYDGTGKLVSPANQESVSKNAELSEICNAIESDIGELQKVIHTIHQNPDKYKISKTLLDSRQQTIHEFRSKVNGIRVHSRQVTAHLNKCYQESTYVNNKNSYGADYSNVQMQHQQDVLNQQNYHLTELHGTAETLHTQAIAFNEEVKSQNRLLHDVEDQMVDSQLHLSTITKKLSRYLDTDHPSVIRLILILSIIIAVLVVILIVF